MTIRWLQFALLASISIPAHAGEAEVMAVEVRKVDAGRFAFEVTVRHADTGLDHYANAWQVLAPDGTVLDTRVLAHPHVDEQPFTRSKTVMVPRGIETVSVRAVDSVHGPASKVVTVELPD